MNRITCLTIALLAVGWAATAHAQIKVVKQPAPAVGPDEEVVYDRWVSSWGLRSDPPDKYPHGIVVHNTLEAARAAAEAHIARTAGHGAWAVTHYLIVGEPSVRKKKTTPRDDDTLAGDPLARLKQAKAAVDELRWKLRYWANKGSANVRDVRAALTLAERKLGDTINEYKDVVAGSYRRAVEAKKTLASGVGGLADAKFREVNALIDKYNGQLRDFQAVMGSEADLGFRPLARVQPRDQQEAVPDEQQLIGTWMGTSVQEGSPDLQTTVVFYADGTVISDGGRGRGRWTLDGDTVRISWSNGAVVTWRLIGNRLMGSGITTRGRSWSITLRKQ